MDERFRMHSSGVFSLQGRTIVTGKIEAGALAAVPMLGSGVACCHWRARAKWR